MTGAAQGIGLAIAARLEEEGARVICCDIDEKAGRAAADGLGAEFEALDVASEEAWEALIEGIASRHGALHILVNNAGIEGNPAVPKDPEQAPLSDWNAIFRVNAAGVFLACKHSIPLIAKSGGGSIVNLSSVASLVPTPFITAYGAAKAAVEHLSRSVALHCARAGQRIRCNSVHPGQVRTPMLEGLFDRLSAEAGTDKESFALGFLASIPMASFQEPVDIANMVLFLASEEARFVTGQAIAVDGGFTLAN